jgi:hypothetical protein
MLIYIAVGTIDDRILIIVGVIAVVVVHRWKMSVIAVVDSNKYFALEIGMDQFFGQRRICERRKLRNVASALMNNALAWWNHLCESNKLPKTRNNVRIRIRKTFIDTSAVSNLNFEIHSLEEQPTIASPIVHNIL